MSYPPVLDQAADGIPVAVTCRVLGFSTQAFYKRVSYTDGPKVRRLSERTVKLLGVSTFYDYFSAPDDQAAASAFAEGPDDAGFDTLRVKTIDPGVLLGQAVALLIREPVSRLTGHPRFVHLVTSPEAESTWIVTLPDKLRDALADEPFERLAEISVPWSQAEEFYGHADPGYLADLLNELAALAGRARSHDHGLYCRMAL